MKTHTLLLAFAICLAGAATTFGQAVVVVVDPTKTAAETKLTADEQTVFDKAISRVRKHIPADTCESGDAGVEVGKVRAKPRDRVVRRLVFASIARECRHYVAVLE